MSGFEVLGVVLGTIPLVISALEHYQQGLHTIRRWHSYEAELQSLKRRLGIEKAIFVNTCEQLLSGIVCSVDHEKLIEEPFGELWAKPEIIDQVVLRLDHVFEPFRETLVAMNTALGEIKAKLGLDEQGEPKWTEGKAIVREIKRATFTFRRSHYDDLLDTISKGNQDLKTLTNQSIQLEPERRVKYHGRLFSQLKEISRSMYRALRNSISCSCPGSHRVSLQLAKPNLASRNEQEQVTHNSNFQCAFSYHMDTTNIAKNDELWAIVELRIYQPPAGQPEVLHVSTDTLNYGKISSITNSILPVTVRQAEPRKKLKRVGFSSENTFSFQTKSPPYSSAATITTSNHTATISAAFSSFHIGTSIAVAQERSSVDPIDICHVIRKGKHRQQGKCYGLISDNTSQRYRKFGVHPLTGNRDDASMISLRDILEDHETTFPGISYADGLKLAIDISSGVLQLSKTSWLPGIITNRDIFFLLEDGCPSYDQAFMARTFLQPDPQSPPASNEHHAPAIKRTMFSLGLLLLEILFFEALDHVWSNKEKEVARGAVGQFSDWRAVRDLLNRAETVSSPRFYSAVHRFLFCEFTCLDSTVGDEAFCKEVYGKTIALLEEDYKSSQSLW